MSNITRLVGQYRLIESKLRPPFLRCQILCRESLVTSIKNHFSNSGALTVVASAGSGKSTLMTYLYDGYSASGEQCFWLSLDSEDNDPAIFSKYILASCYEIDEEYEETELAFFEANQSRDYSAFLDFLVARLANIKVKSVIFVDDFQFITDPIIIRFWNRLIQYSTPFLRIAIGSRNQLPLELGRRQISGLLTEITQLDLNLNAREVGAYLREVHEVEIPEQSAELLRSLTEGWIAGVQLAALAIGRDRVDAVSYIENFTGKDKVLTEYLLQSVLGGLPDAIREFLLSTSPLLRFNADLCDYVSQCSNGVEMIKYLNQNNIFIVPEDNVGIWYRYHHLFVDFLRSELQRFEPKKYDRICILAASWCEDNDFLTEAVQYCLLAKNFNRAAELIIKRGPDLAQLYGDHYTVMDWMRRLPAEYHTMSPQLLLVFAWSSTFSRDPALAVSLCEKVFSGIENVHLYNWKLDKDEEIEVFWFAKTIVAIAGVVADKLKDSISLCELIIENVPSSQVFTLSTAHCVMAYALLGLREHQESINYAVEGYRYGVKSGSKFASVWADFISGLANIELGRLNSAIIDASRASTNAGSEDANNAYLRAMADFIHNEVHVQKCNFDVVQHRLKYARTFTSLYGPAEPLLTSIRGDARHLFWVGEFEAACKVLRNGQEIALSTDQVRLYIGLLAEEVELQLRFNSADAAKEAIRRVNFYSFDRFDFPDELAPWVEETIRVIKIRMHIADGRIDEALRKISDHIDCIVKQGQGRVRCLHRLRSLKAICLWRNGSIRESIRELDRVIDVAAPEDQAYEIVMAGSEIAEILQEMRSKRARIVVDKELKKRYEFVDRLILIFNGADYGVGEKEDSASVDPNISLTGREIDILKLICAGLDNNQIAEDLKLSVATVKWHLHNIFQKIGVRTRTAAAAYGHKIKLI
ncbi:LuxR C-terminal-related transcriptional regulator [Zhongshania sp.]|uniref:LuxR C-terminal-related transcriptional regulator n=1 Tax=Zhongshania sp. TaxID=1971902 RepID=UPI0035674D18